jgi:membrane associated rhomboid family serine protease
MDWYRRFLRQFGFAGLLLSVLAISYVALLILFVVLREKGFNTLFMAMALPMNVDTAVNQPWSVFTFWLANPPMLFWVLLVDMVTLYAFGHILNALLGDRRMQRIFVIAVVANSMLTIAFANLLGTVEGMDTAPIFGFSSINATLIAAAITLVPRYNFRILFWNIPLLYIGVLLLGASIASYRAVFTATGLSLMVGALTGFVIIKVMQNGIDIVQWFRVRPENQRHQPTPREPVYSQHRPVVKAINPKQKATSPQNPLPEMSEEEELDRLLDRINEVGYDALSRHEKERLDKLAGK